MTASPWFSLSCMQAGCDEPASHVVVQSSDMAGVVYMVTGFVLAFVFLLLMGVHGELRLAASWVCATVWQVGYYLGMR